MATNRCDFQMEEQDVFKVYHWEINKIVWF